MTQNMGIAGTHDHDGFHDHEAVLYCAQHNRSLATFVLGMADFHSQKGVGRAGFEPATDGL